MRIFLSSVPLVRVSFTLNENETRARSALWLAGANEPTNQSAGLTLVPISLNVKLSRTKGTVTFKGSCIEYSRKWPDVTPILQSKSFNQRCLKGPLQWWMFEISLGSYIQMLESPLNVKMVFKVFVTIQYLFSSDGKTEYDA